eukprot:scaffold66376_cov43-Attheya_sp.AAC.1
MEWKFVGQYEHATCFLPQVEALHAIHQHYPHATFLLTTLGGGTNQNKDGENVDADVVAGQLWANSLGTDPDDPSGLANRLLHCDSDFEYDDEHDDVLPKLTYPRTKDDLVDFYVQHVRRIRQFVQLHPTHSLVEVSVDTRTAAGATLQDAFGISAASCWNPFSPSKQQAARAVSHPHPPGPGPERPLQLPTPVIVMGFPKTGTTSLSKFFSCGGHEAAHTWAIPNRTHPPPLGTKEEEEEVKPERCGKCMKENIGRKRPPLEGCGAFDIWSDCSFANWVDKTYDVDCYFPMLQGLAEIHAAYPHATFLLGTRDPDTWYQSVSKWGDLEDRLIHCNATGFPNGNIHVHNASARRDSLTTLLTTQNQLVREFVAHHPSHTLVEVDIHANSSATTATKLSHAFGISSDCWKNIPPNKGKVNSIKQKELEQQLLLENGVEVVEGPKVLNVPTPIFVAGLPKTGTSSVAKYFKCGGHKAAHTWYTPNRPMPPHMRLAESEKCGVCIKRNVDASRPPFEGCGDANIWSDCTYSSWADLIHTNKNTKSSKTTIDRPGVVPTWKASGVDCYFPMVDDLEAIHASYPNATILLTTRPSMNWVKSLSKWSDLMERFTHCNATGFPNATATHQDFATFFEAHSANIRQFVKKYPSHLLVDINVESPEAPVTLEASFGVNSSLCWKNVKPLGHKRKQTKGKGKQLKGKGKGKQLKLKRNMGHLHSGPRMPKFFH